MEIKKVTLDVKLKTEKPVNLGGWSVPRSTSKM